MLTTKDKVHQKDDNYLMFMNFQTMDYDPCIIRKILNIKISSIPFIITCTILAILCKSQFSQWILIHI